MNTQVCVICLNKKPVNQTNNRLVTESCGHVKCMDCLLREKSGCQACLSGPSEVKEELGSKPGSIDLSPDVSLIEEDSSNGFHLEDLSKKKKPNTSHISVEMDSNGKFYVCTVCKKKFHARSQVAYHAYCNGQLKPYQCPECNKSFATHSHFKYHMRVHRNERTYACDVCGDSFFQMSKLQRHKLKHTKEKKYVCGQCNKAFNNVTSLRKHELTHTEERPYACSACGRRFRDNSNYRKHLAKHEASKSAGGPLGRSPRGVRRPHQCPRCPQAFHSRKDMRRHAAVHTDSKPFRCKVCNRHFRRKDNLERHIRNTHPDYVPASAVECDESALEQISGGHPTPDPDEKREKTMLEILNPLPPLPQEVIQKHIMEVNENVSQNNQQSKEKVIDKSYILEANNARQSVIVGKCLTPERKVNVTQADEYIHKIRKANSMVSQKNVTLPPIDEEKIKQLTRLNNLDVGSPPKNMELYKKILYEKPEIEGGGHEEEKVRSSSPEMHWRRKMKLNINCDPKFGPVKQIIHRSEDQITPGHLFSVNVSGTACLHVLFIYKPFEMNTEDNLVNIVVDLYKEGNWKDIVERYHDHPERNKLLWVFPSEDNLKFIQQCLLELGCSEILSIGCGSGLLEWIITKATGLPVSGVEVDGTWWHCKYAPATFISLLLTGPELEKDIIDILQSATETALLFCYFNNRPAFEEYIKYFSGNVLVIIGPGYGKGVHTDPKPFGDVNNDWKMYKWQEVRKSQDFIAVYQRN